MTKKNVETMIWGHTWEANWGPLTPKAAHLPILPIYQLCQSLLIKKELNKVFVVATANRTASFIILIRDLSLSLKITLQIYNCNLTSDYRSIGLPHSMDTVISWSGNKRTYFFKNENYWKLDDGTLKFVEGYPRDITKVWMKCSS